MANETLCFSACEVGSDMTETVPEIFWWWFEGCKVETRCENNCK
jgi:hypothetical protein